MPLAKPRIFVLWVALAGAILVEAPGCKHDEEQGACCAADGACTGTGP
jgi:hypothetical protein